MPFKPSLAYLVVLSLWVAPDTFGQTLRSEWHLANLSMLTCLAFSPDQNFLASGGGFGITVWDLRSGNIVQSLRSRQRVACSLAFSRDNKTLATGNHEESVFRDRSLKFTLWDVQSGTAKTAAETFQGLIYLIKFSPEGRRVATASRTRFDNTSPSEVRVYDTRTMKLLNRFTSEQTGSASHALEALAEGKWDGSGLPTDDAGLASQEVEQRLSKLRVTDPKLRHMKVSRQTKSAVALRGSTAVLFDLSNADLTPRRSIALPDDDRIHSIAISPDNTVLAVGRSHEELDEKNDNFDTLDSYVALRNLQTGKRVRTLSAHINGVFKFALSTDRATMVTTGLGGKIIIWDTAALSQQVALTGYGRSGYNIALSPDNGSIAVGGNDKTIKVLDISSGKEVQHFSGVLRNITFLTYSPDGRYLAAGGPLATWGQRSNIQIWDLNTMKPTKLFHSDGFRITWLSFAPDGRTLFSREFHGTVKLWDLPSSKLVRTLAQNTDAVALSHDGQSLAIGEKGGAIRLLSTRDAATLLTLAGHTGKKIIALAFSPDDQRLGSGTLDGNARIWDLNTGHMLAALPRKYKGEIQPKYFSADGKTLYALSGSALQTWDLSGLVSAPPADSH